MNLHSVGVFTTDTDLIIQVWDAALARLTGISPIEASGRPLSVVIPDIETRGLIRNFRRVLEDGVIEVLAPAFHSYLIPCPPQVPSERFGKMLQRVTIAPLRQDGSVAGLIVTIEDVTGRVDNERDRAAQLTQGGVRNEEILAALGDESWRIRRTAIDQVLRRAAPDAIAALLISVRENHRNLGLLNSALEVLRLSDIDTQSALIEFLTGPDADLRMQAALALGEQKDARAIPDLLAALKDENENVAYHAIEALGKLRAKEAVDPLVGIAESKDFFLAFPALEALGEIGDPQVSSRLIPLLQDSMLCDPTARTLAMLGDERAAEAFVQILNNEDAPTETIAQSLVVLYERYEALYSKGRSIAELCDRFVRPNGVQNLIDALARADGQTLRPLVLVLGWLHSPAAARAITRHLGRVELGTEVLANLVNQGPTVTNLLIDQLKSEDFETRSSAIKALGRIRDKRATGALTALLGKEDELTIPLIGALASLGDPEAVNPLFAMLRTNDAAIRKAAVSALTVLGSAAIVERVIPLLEDPHPGVREAAVRISGHFGGQDCANALLSRCHDEHESVRRAAVEHLPFLGDSRAPKVLSEALFQDVPMVRAAAAAAMAHVQRTDAVPLLIRALKDEDPWVRYFAARSLDSHRAVETASDLYRLAQSDKFQQVRIAAFEALSRMDETLAVPIAKSFVASADPDLQHIASILLARSNGTS